jgi:hypothetical protein
MNRTIAMLIASSLAVACTQATKDKSNALPTTADPVKHTHAGPGPNGSPDFVTEEQDESATGDAGADADAATAQVTCADPSTDGAYYFRCSAAAPDVAGGGTIEPGSYVLAGYWENACTYEYGSAEVFVENGKTYMRYQRIAKSDLTEAGQTFTGTWRLDATADGAITRTDVCGVIAAPTTGRFEQTDDLVFVFSDTAETWRKQ